MSHWNGKYVIGLTGNIATGKSVVRRMLEHLGAFGIDADSLAHRTIDTGTPGFTHVVEAFGKEILDADGQVNRGRLGQIVFSDPQALQRLEAIVHPLVLRFIERIMNQARQPVVVIEAIKLIESGLYQKCDSLWVVDSEREVQIRRLIEKRSYTHEAALQRILAQPSQEIKIAHADLVIVNNDDFESTWQQLKKAWDTIVPSRWKEHFTKNVQHAITFKQTTPDQAEAIGGWINLHSASSEVSTEKLLDRFSEQGFLEITWDGDLCGIIGWKTDNFIASVSELYLDQNLNPENLLECLLEGLEEKACQNLCEVIVFSLSEGEGRFIESLEKCGYQMWSTGKLRKRAWQEFTAAQKISGRSWWKPLTSDALWVANEIFERNESA